MMLIIRPNNTLQFQFILILMNASEQSFPYFVFKISSYIFWVLLLIFFLYMLCTQMTFDFTSHIHQSQQKLISWSIFCNIYMVQTFLKILCWRFLVPRPERLFVSNVTSSCNTWNLSTLLMLVNYNTNNFFLVLKFSHSCNGLFSSLWRF